MNKISPFINFFSIKVVVIQQKVSCFQIVSIMYSQYILILLIMRRLHLSSLYVGHLFYKTTEVLHNLPNKIDKVPSQLD